MTRPAFAGSKSYKYGNNAVREGPPPNSKYRIKWPKWFTTRLNGGGFLLLWWQWIIPEALIFPLSAGQAMIHRSTGYPDIKFHSKYPNNGRWWWRLLSQLKWIWRCLVPVENLIGEEGQGFFVSPGASGTWNGFTIACRWMESVKRAFDMMFNRAVSRPADHGKAFDKQNHRKLDRWIRAEIKSQPDWNGHWILLNKCRKKC